MQARNRRYRLLFKTVATVAAIALIVLLAYGATSKGRRSAQNAVCQGNLRHIGLVLREYVKTVKGSYFPPLCSQPGVLMFSPQDTEAITVRLNIEVRKLFTCPATRYVDSATGSENPFGNVNSGVPVMVHTY